LDEARESPAPGTDSAHRLDAKKLIDSFARMGVLCAVLRPSDQEIGTLESILPPITESSDVVVIDWVLREFKQGEKTIEIIRQLLKSSGPERGRARLIIVYTGENHLNPIASAIRETLRLPEQDGSGDPFTIKRGAARICIYAKEQSRLPADEQSRKVEIGRLPAIVVAEFANMTRGLVCNVALRSLARLRANTHQLLRRFHSELDPPYVTHSTLLAPEEASDHLIPLIVSEIQAVLEDERVSDLANHRRVLQWLDHQMERGLTFTQPNAPTGKEFRQGLAYLLEHGTTKEALKKLFNDHPKFATSVLTSRTKALDIIHNQLTGLVALEGDRQKAKDHELAVLMSVRSHYSSPTPLLALGSIVLETNPKQLQYLLCVQPRCDSVRLESERAFPFLPMQQVAGDQKCDFIIGEKDKTLRLRLNDDPFEARMIKFAPAKPSDKEILARRGKSGLFFKASNTRAKYRWIADLKAEHAQRVANEYAYKLSRVGLTESEWLRRWMPRRDE
jgi:hypothetical protein